MAAWLSLSTTIFSSLKYTVDRSVANTDAYTVGVTVHGPEQSLVFKKKIHNTDVPNHSAGCKVFVWWFHGLECVTARLREFEEDSRSEVVFWIDEWSVEFDYHLSSPAPSGSSDNSGRICCGTSPARPQQSIHDSRRCWYTFCSVPSLSSSSV